MPLLHREKKNEEEETSRPRKRWKFRLWPIVLFLALMAGSFIMGAVLTHQESEPVITADLLGQQLRDIQELSTVEYHYTNMGRFENQKDFYGWKVPFTTKSFIVAYDGVIKAGVDLSQMEVTVQDKTITVTLPEGKILSHEIDENSLEVFDESKNIFNPIRIEDYTGFTADQRASMEERATEEGLLTAASERARTLVEQFIAALPNAQEYTINIT